MSPEEAGALASGLDESNAYVLAVGIARLASKYDIGQVGTDAAKVEVMKAQITESALTERHRLTEQATTDRERIQSERSVKHESYNNDSYNWVRFAFILLLGACVAGATCVGYHKIELETYRIQAQSSTAPSTPADAGVSPSTTGK